MTYHKAMTGSVPLHPLMFSCMHIIIWQMLQVNLLCIFSAMGVIINSSNNKKKKTFWNYIFTFSFFSCFSLSMSLSKYFLWSFFSSLSSLCNQENDISKI